jgi:antitoxin component YwqK of YwqJK toxin-antitoxin module/ankyrin repeat protein
MFENKDIIKMLEGEKIDIEDAESEFKTIRYKNGKGKLYYQNGKVRYEGEYKDGKPEGKGKLYDKNRKLKYDGEFKDGKYNGKGKLYWEDGKRRYEGEFKDGAFFGKGKEYYRNDKLRYDGEYKDGKPVEGRLFDESGNLKYEGQFLNFEYNGKGKGYYPNGKLRYKGEFKDGKPKEGKLYYESGNLWYEGEYKNGKGKEYYPNGKLEYEGEYKNGKYNGKGKQYWENGNLRYEGEFKDGRYNEKGKESRNKLVIKQLIYLIKNDNIKDIEILLNTKIKNVVKKEEDLEYINMVDEEGMTALHYASKLGNDKIIKLLLEIKELDVNKQDDGGWTALHYASSFKCEKCIELLLSHKDINIHLADKYEDLTPIQIAENIKIEELFRKKIKEELEERRLLPLKEKENLKKKLLEDEKFELILKLFDDKKKILQDPFTNFKLKLDKGQSAKKLEEYLNSGFQLTYYKFSGIDFDDFKRAIPIILKNYQDNLNLGMNYQGITKMDKLNNIKFFTKKNITENLNLYTYMVYLYEKTDFEKIKYLYLKAKEGNKKAQNILSLKKTNDKIITWKDWDIFNNIPKNKFYSTFNNFFMKIYIDKINDDKDDSVDKKESEVLYEGEYVNRLDQNKLMTKFHFDKETKDLNLGNILKIIIYDFIERYDGKWNDDSKVTTEYLSKGSFGKGFKLIHESNGKQRKYFFKISTKSSDDLIKEYENYLMFNHPNITKELIIYNYNSSNNNINFFWLEIKNKKVTYIKESDKFHKNIAVLFTEINDNTISKIDNYEWNNYIFIIKFLLVIIETLYYMFKNKKNIHQDLKPDNIMYKKYDNDNNYYFKLIDFGGTTVLNKKMGTNLYYTYGSRMHTPYYVPKEIYKEWPNYITDETDVYSIGVSLMKLLGFDINEFYNKNFFELVENYLNNINFTSKSKSNNKIVKNLLKKLILNMVDKNYERQNLKQIIDDLNTIVNLLDNDEKKEIISYLIKNYEKYGIPDVYKNLINNDLSINDKCALQLKYMIDNNKIGEKLKKLKLSTKFITCNYLSYNDKLTTDERFFDPGRGAINAILSYINNTLTYDKIIKNASREIMIIDHNEIQEYLKNDFTKTKYKIDEIKKKYEDDKRLNNITKKKLEGWYNYLAEIVLFLFNNKNHNLYSINEPKMNQLGEKKEETSIIEFIKIRSGVCRHRSIFFKYLCDYVGLKCRLIRGYYSKNSKDKESKEGGHAWNIIEIYGEKFIIDIMNPNWDLKGLKKFKKRNNLYNYHVPELITNTKDDDVNYLNKKRYQSIGINTRETK